MGGDRARRTRPSRRRGRRPSSCRRGRGRRSTVDVRAAGRSRPSPRSPRRRRRRGAPGRRGRARRASRSSRTKVSTMRRQTAGRVAGGLAASRTCAPGRRRSVLAVARRRRSPSSAGCGAPAGWRRTPSCWRSRRRTATLARRRPDRGRAALERTGLASPVGRPACSTTPRPWCRTRPASTAPSLTIPISGELPDGTYTVAWDVISEDSHPISGATVFYVGAPSTAGPGRRRRRAAAGWGVRTGAAILTSLGYAGALVAAGAWWFVVVAGPWSAGAAAPDRRPRRAGRGARRGVARRGRAAAHRPPRRRSRRAPRQRPAGRVAEGAARDRRRS